MSITYPATNNFDQPGAVKEPAQTSNGLRNFISRMIVQPARKWLLYRQGVSELASLDDRMLRDIGVNRYGRELLAYQQAYGTQRVTRSGIQTARSAVNDNKYDLSGQRATGPGRAHLKAA